MMAIAPPITQPSPSAIPPLENGDHLTRDEFERRYQAMPGVKKAELLEGIVYMPSPVHFRGHSRPHQDINAWIAVYRAATPGLLSGTDGSVRLDVDNEPQPDVFLFLPKSAGGRAEVDADDYVAGAPELVVEVAASTTSRDLHVKRHVYRRNGVREYLVWRVREQAVDWLVLRGGEFVPMDPGPDGIHRSEVFPGLWLDTAALLQGDLAGVLRVLHQGLASPEHADFAARLAATE